jgi:hypothetical protein
MKLADWLIANQVSDDDFAARIETSRQAVWRYKSGRIPERETMVRIVRATGGLVQPNDFYGVEA